MRKLRYLVLILAPLLVSCSDSKTPSEQQQAEVRWDNARSAVLIGLARDQYTNGNFDKSRSTIDEALKLSPGNASAHELSAKLYIESGQLEMAERELTSARLADPTSAEAEYLSGVVFQRWQQPDRALECYQHACDKAPGEMAYVMAKAEMLVAMDRRDDALATLQAKVSYFDHSGVIRDEVGLLLEQQKRYPQAIEMLQRAAILASDDLTIKEHLAMAQYYGGVYAESADNLTRLLANPGYDHRGDLMITLGECQLQTGHAGDAVQNLQRASELMPNALGVWLGLARAELQLNNVRRADLALRRAAEIDATCGETSLLVGYVRLHEGRLREAFDAFAQASHSDPNDGVSRCMQGFTLNKLGRSREAAEYYRQALRLNPTDEMALHLMARLDPHE